jgi:exodeoxyribonuclease V alpha subunit
LTASTVLPLERHKVQVASILWSGETATAFTGRVSPAQSITIVGKGRSFRPVVGEVYEVAGEWYDSPKYGRQLYGDGEGFRRLLPSGALLVPWLQSLDGVGPARAKRIVKTFKGNLEGVFEGGVPLDKLADAIDPERPNLAARVAVAVTRRWQEIKDEYETIQWLENQGVEDVRIAKQAARLLGPRAVEILSRNPYVLATILPWARLDQMAKRVLRRRPDLEDHIRCPERLVGAMDVVVQEHVSDGHTAFPKAGFTAAVARKLGLDETPDLAARILYVGQANRAIIDGDDLWRAPGCAIMEDEIRARFAAMASGSEKGGVRIPGDVDLRRILAMVERRGRSFHQEQRDAVLKVIRNPVACLTGGAGTGKTTTCRAIVDLWEILGGHVELAALSGKAALRLTAGAGRDVPGRRPALTIHRLLLGLKKRGEGQTYWGQTTDDGKPPDPARELPQLTNRTLLVIDEASMVDLGQMHQLVEIMPPGCRLLLVGDAFQLPPIGFGLVFHHLVSQPEISAALETIRRQEDGTGIPEISRIIRSRQKLDLAPYRLGQSGVSFVHAAEGRISETIEAVVRDLGGFSAGPQALMVLAPVNHRPNRPDGTVRDLNRRFHLRNLGDQDLTEEELETCSVSGYLGNAFAEGDPVTFLRNDYDVGLRNGSLGRVVAINPKAGTVTCDFEGDEKEFGNKDLIDLSLAYALSCHRAQGSQAKAVVISLLDAPNVDPSWIYTAVTRAEENAVLVGDLAVLERTLARTPAFDRRLTGSAMRLS